MPLVPQSFSQLISFTRTSAATYVNSAGNIVTTPASKNLLTFTEEFDNAAWTKTNCQIVPNVDPAAATYGAELVTNGTFDSGTTGWSGNANATISVVSGALRVTAIANGIAYASQAITTVPGRTYRITATYVTDAITGNAFLYAGTVAGSGNVGNLTIGSTLGAHTLYFVATGTTTYISVSNSTLGLAGEYMDFDNISVREVIGGLITAPDGTLTGDALVETAATSGHVVSSSATVTTSAHVFSVYLKKGSGSTAPNWLQLYTGGVSAQYANFNLGTGAVGSVAAGSTATITSMGNGWYRCTLTFTPSSGGSASVAIAFTNNTDTTTRGPSYAGATTSDVFAWGAQLEAASSATDYTRNFGGLFPPRFDYDPVTLQPRGLLIEEQRTNLLTYSEQFDNAAWFKINGSVTANATTSPDGTVDADLLVPNTSNAQHRLDFVTTSTAATHAFSAYLKAGGYGFARLRFGSNGGFVDLSSGAISGVMAGYTMTATAVGNGWYRVVLVGAAALNETVRINCELSALGNDFTGDGTSGIYIWGAQLEAGAFATSYIPTVASQVTRTADQASIVAPNFAPWYNQSSGSFLIEWRQGGSEAVQIAASVNDGTANNIMSVLNDNSSAAGVTPGAAVTNGGVAQANLTGAAITAGSTNKAALAYALNDFAYSQNGAAALTDTSGTVPTVDRLDIGNRVSALFTNGHIRSIRYYPTRLTNTQLQALTA